MSMRSLLRSSRLLALTLAVGMVPGLPAAADPVRILGDTPALLRAPEPALFDLDCGAIERKLNGLDTNRVDESIRRTQALIDAARADSSEAFARAADEAKGAVPGIVESLATKKLELLNNLGGLKGRLKALEAAGVPREQAASWLRVSKGIHGVENPVNDLAGKLDTLATSYNDSQGLRLALDRTKAANGTLGEELGRLHRDVVDSGLPKDLGSAVAGLGGPVTSIAFEVGHLAIVGGTALAEGLIHAKRDLPAHEAHLADMRRAKMNIELKIAALRRDLGECRAEVARRNEPQPQRVASRAIPQAPSAPVQVPSAPVEPPASPKASSGPSLGPVFLIGGLAAAGGAAYAAGVAMKNAQTASTGGSSAGSSAGSCHTSRNCIVSSLGNGCSCSSTFNVCFAGASAGQPCGSGCASGLMCVNGRCKSSCP